MPRATTWWGREPIADRTNGRTTTLQQLLVGAMALFSTMVAIAMDALDQRGFLLGGLFLIILLTGIVIAVPWNPVPPLWAALLPIGDILAIAMMRQNNPSSGFALLWVFPAMWLAGSFGLIGVICANVLVNGLYWAAVAVDPSEGLTPTVVLLPMMIAGVTLTTHLASRRAAYQRILLHKQARLLARSVEQARHQEDTLAEVLDAVDFGVIRIEPNGTESVRNGAHARMQRMLGPDEHRPALYSADGMTKLTAEDTPLARARRGEAFDQEIVWHGTPGTGRRALSVTSRALHGNRGTSEGRILVSRDVTDEVTALRAREDLVASVSHELRTPLTSILGYLELVLDADDLTPRARGRLEIAERNATRLLTLVADILAVSADGRGGAQLSTTPEMTRLDHVVTTAVEAVHTGANERRMTVDGTAIEEVTAFVDPLRIRQVLDNVLGNAVKYGRTGGRIDVGVTQDGDHAWIVVRDDGPGISAKEIPQLFDRFFRADAVRQTSTHGSGLGLSISRDIVRAHGGEITVQSEPDAGATFIIRLPIRATERPD